MDISFRGHLTEQLFRRRQTKDKRQKAEGISGYQTEQLFKSREVVYRTQKTDAVSDISGYQTE